MRLPLAQAKKIEPRVLLEMRLAPDMFPLTRQVQIACRFAEESAARLAGAEVVVGSSERYGEVECDVLRLEHAFFLARLIPLMIRPMKEMTCSRPPRLSSQKQTRFLAMRSKSP